MAWIGTPPLGTYGGRALWLCTILMSTWGSRFLVMIRLEPTARGKVMSVLDNIVQASNLLTHRWVQEFAHEGNHLVSGVGSWMLFTSLLGVSSDEARTELEAAMSIARSEAISSVDAQLEHVSSLDGVSCAIGFWVHEEVPVRAGVCEGIGRLSIASLPIDQAELDSWVRNATGGLVETFPVDIGEGAMFALATALAAQADWLTPFEAGFTRWRGDGEAHGWLVREDSDAHSASLLSRGSLTVSRVICHTTAGFEVHLVAGSSDDTPGAVLGLAVEGLSGAAETVSGSELRMGDAGGALMVEEALVEPNTRLIVSLPAFEIQSIHDLLACPNLFGLVAATDRTAGHFPGLSEVPLVVKSASQSVMAGFSAGGFRAAAVTEVGLALGESRAERKIVVQVVFDRPFGFLVVDPSSGLALFAGWVDQPVQRVQEMDFEEPRIWGMA